MSTDSAGETKNQRASLPPAQAVGPAGWILLIVLSLIYTDFVLTALEEVKFPLQPMFPASVWTGVTVAYFWRRKNRSGWAGFGIGVLISLLLVLVLMFVRGIVHAS